MERDTPITNVEKENCVHHFEYSHKETQLITYGSTNFREVDVVICTKCGTIKRN